ncbi:MAG: HNH endonuclease [Bacillota bacterium]
MYGRPATDLDHRVSKRKGGTDDPANLQALCHQCHSAKTAREDGRFGQRAG